MNTNQYERELFVALAAAHEAAESIRTAYFTGRVDVQRKGDGTLVTNVDLAANDILLGRLHDAFPDDAIVSEEDKPILGGERSWYIDPIDGTSGFATRSDQFAVHIGFTVEEQPVLGVVYKPTTHEHYVAIKGEGAFRTGPRGNKTFLRVAAGDDRRLIMGRKFTLKRQDLVQRLEATDVLTSGSEGLRIMKIAEGLADWHFSEGDNRCNTWDLCAPQVIAEEAGAYIAFTDGTPIIYQGQGKLGKQFVAARSQALGEYASRVLRSQ